jgi:RAMP superfamily
VGRDWRPENAHIRYAQFLYEGEGWRFSKEAFATGKAARFEVQGQKAYLHHAASSNPDAQPFKTNRPNERQSFVTPLRAGVQFTFDIRFDNLSEAELDLLCFAIRPSEAFRHKIGYAKPLGLGSVRIDPVGLTLIDRAARYRAQSVFAAAPSASEPLAATFGEGVSRHTAALKAADPAALNAILLIGETHDFGDRQNDGVPVLWVPLTEARYADVKAGRNAEDESFAWFQANDKRKHQAQRLRPITASDTEIPTLWTGVKGIRRMPAQATARALDRYAGIIQPFTENARTRVVVEEDDPDPGVATILPNDLAALGGAPLQAGERIEFSVKESSSKQGQMLAFDIVRLL